MRVIREGVFETNSSSTHTLIIPNGIESLQNNNEDLGDYLPLSKHIKIEWISTDDYYRLDTLKEKLSYIISQIALKLTYNCNNYEELKEELEENYEFQKICEFVKTHYDKEIRFPENKDGIYDDMDCIIEINHQLIPWDGSPAEETLNDLLEYCQDKEDPNRWIEDDNDPEKPKRLWGSIKKDHLGDDGELEMSFEEKLAIYLDKDTYITFGRD